MINRLCTNATLLVISLGAPQFAWSHPGHAPLREGIGGTLHALASMDHLLIPAALGFGFLAAVALAGGAHRAIAALSGAAGLAMAALAAA